MMVDIPIDAVVVGEGRRELRRLGELAASIREVGLLNPITVTENRRLVAGYHRLEACRILGWKVIPYPEYRVLHDRLICKHGNSIRKHSGQSARTEYEKYGKCGMSGHTHRRGVYEHRDHNGFHAWWELGMLGSIRHDYVDYADWTQGFAVVTWSDDREHFGVEEVRIHEGVTYFRGKRYVGDSKLFD